MRRFSLLLLLLALTVRTCYPHKLPYTRSIFNAPKPLYPRQTLIQMCNDDQAEEIVEVLRTLDYLLFLITNFTAQPLPPNNHMTRRFVHHFGRRNQQYRQRVTDRLNAVRDECRTSPGRLPIFCYDVEERCHGDPDRSLYLDGTRSFIVLVRPSDKFYATPILFECRLMSINSSSVPSILRTCPMGRRLPHPRPNRDVTSCNAKDTSDFPSHSRQPART